MYDPKIDNQAEDWFYHELSKRTSAKITPQFEVPVGRSPYRLDYLIESRNSRVGFEVDGKKYHNISDDSYRDKMILHKHLGIEAIVRFEAHDVYWNAPLATLFICDHFPDLIFSNTPPSRKARTAGEIERLESEGNEYNRVGKAKKDAWSYLKIRGVHHIEFLTKKENHGYDEYTFSVYFMDADMQIEYLNDLEDNVDHKTNPIEYCNEKISKVRVMRNAKN